MTLSLLIGRTQKTDGRSLRHSGGIKKWGAALVAVSALSFGVISAPSTATAAPATAGYSQTTNVMAPLIISDWATRGPQWTAFLGQLTEAKKIGISAVTTDVWWGTVQSTSPTSFDWSYYDALFAAIDSAGLKIAPIMSFHACGVGVGDKDCNIPLPDFVWQDVEQCSPAGCTTVHADDWLVSEFGNQSKSAVAPWGPGVDRAHGYMEAFMKAFQTHFSGYANKIQEISAGVGPSAECRYPSYDPHDNFAGSPANYPGRGALQSYTASAIKSFSDWVLQQAKNDDPGHLYTPLQEVNNRWGLSGKAWALTSLSQISPPTDHDGFFTSGSYYNTQYGKDFTRWYSTSLLNSCQDIMKRTLHAFNGAFANLPIAMKIPGVGWQTMAGSPYLRAPEVAAGLINTDQSYNDASTGFGYAPILSMLDSLKVRGSGSDPVTHSIELYYTALEKPDAKYDGGTLAYSASATQVGWIADASYNAGILLKGENALNGGLYSDGSAGASPTPGWMYIRQAFDRSATKRYYGITLLRISDVTPAGSVPRAQLESFIKNYG